MSLLKCFPSILLKTWLHATLVLILSSSDYLREGWLRSGMISPQEDKTDCELEESGTAELVGSRPNQNSGQPTRGNKLALSGGHAARESALPWD